MGVYVEVEKNEFLREIRTQGMGSLLQGQLESRFGPLPQWAFDRLRFATTEQIQRWGKLLLTEKTLEDVLEQR